MGVPAVRVIDQEGKVMLDPDAILKALKDNAADARRAMTGNTGAVRRGGRIRQARRTRDPRTRQQSMVHPQTDTPKSIPVQRSREKPA